MCDSGTEPPLKKCEYYVFTYERLEEAIILASKLNAMKTRYFVIVDETHNFANDTSERTMRLDKLQNMNDNTYFIWTTGTPILKSAAELVTFLKASDPRFDNDAMKRFKRIYSASPGRAGEIFNHRLGQMMAVAVPQSAVLTSKPTVIELPVTLPPGLANRFLMSTIKIEMAEFIKGRLEYYAPKMKEYRQYVDKVFQNHEKSLKTRSEIKAFEQYKYDIKVISAHPDLMLNELMSRSKTYERRVLLPSLPPRERKYFKSVLSATKNIKLKVRGEALGTILSKRRSECATALGLYCKPEIIVKESLSKTLFFASSIEPIVTLGRDLEKKGLSPRLVYADTNSRLTEIITSFTHDPEVNPLLATMQSLSEAVPVLAASTIVFLNRPFRESQYSQAVARSMRMGQKFPVTVIEVTLDTGGEPNVSSTTDDILNMVREQINILIGPDFAGPDPDERQYKETIDASKEMDYLQEQDTKLGL